MHEVKYTYRSPSVSEYQMLRATTSWNQFDDTVIRKSLEKDLFAIVAEHESSAIGMARIIGDGALYFYVQDVIVHPRFQGMGIGKQLMQRIESFLKDHAPTSAFIGLMAASGTREFYEDFGYKIRPADGPGMYRIV